MQQTRILPLICTNMTFNSSGSNTVTEFLPKIFRRHFRPWVISSALSRASWFLSLFEHHLTQDERIASSGKRERPARGSRVPVQAQHLGTIWFQNEAVTSPGVMPGQLFLFSEHQLGKWELRGLSQWRGMEGGASAT